MIHYWIIGLVAVGLVLYFFIVRAPSQTVEEPDVEEGPIDEDDDRP